MNQLGTQTETSMQQINGFDTDLFSSFAYGVDKQVQKSSVSIHRGQLIIDEPELAMQFNSAVTKVQFVGSQYLAAISEDSQAHLMDVNTGKVKKFPKGGHEGSVRNFAVDPLSELIATIGCDGTLIISSIKDESILAKLQKVAKPTQIGSTQHLELAWHETGEYLYVAGDCSLTVVARREINARKPAKSVIHDKEISHVCVLTNRLLATVSLDQVIKVWQSQDAYLQVDCDLKYKFKVSNPVSAIKYCP